MSSLYKYLYMCNKLKTVNVLKAIRENSPKGIYISSLTFAELEHGVENSKQIWKRSGTFVNGNIDSAVFSVSK